MYTIIKGDVMKMRKIKCTMSGLLVVLLTLSLIPTTASALDGANEPTVSHWYDDAMSYCAETSLFDGIPTELIAPDSQVTWAIIAQIFANRTANYQAERYQVTTEDDQTNPWYAPALKWMNENGVFDYNEPPESQISREAVVRLLFEYAYKTESTTDVSITNSSSRFTDQTAIHEESKSAVDWAEEHGVIHGYGDSSFRPTQPILFSEMAQMFYNAKDLLSKNKVTVLFSYSVSDIEKIEFQNGNTGELLSYTDETKINDIIEHLNAFRYDQMEPAGDGWTYAVRIWFKDDSAIKRIELSSSSACVEGNRYISSEHDYFPQKWIKQYCP
jgi:hypothetical protein